jgi:hypothetical protein
MKTCPDYLNDISTMSFVYILVLTYSCLTVGPSHLDLETFWSYDALYGGVIFGYSGGRPSYFVKCSKFVRYLPTICQHCSYVEVKCC